MVVCFSSCFFWFISSGILSTTCFKSSTNYRQRHQSYWIDSQLYWSSFLLVRPCSSLHWYIPYCHRQHQGTFFLDYTSLERMYTCIILPERIRWLVQVEGLCRTIGRLDIDTIIVSLTNIIQQWLLLTEGQNTIPDSWRYDEEAGPDLHHDRGGSRVGCVEQEEPRTWRRTDSLADSITDPLLQRRLHTISFLIRFASFSATRAAAPFGEARMAGMQPRLTIKLNSAEGRSCPTFSSIYFMNQEKVRVYELRRTVWITDSRVDGRELERE